MPDRRPIVNPSNLQELVNTDGLIAGESAALVEQSVSPATPASGYGIVYAKTDGKLYFKNDAGTETDLTATGGGTNPVIREYTANATWTKPTAANFWGVMVLCVGAGGGGGSGRRGASLTNRLGGGGGGGGAYAYRIVRSAQLTLSSYAITIGTGSTGGSAITSDNNNGNNSVFGGNSSFGSFVVAAGGGGGSGGTSTTGSGGSGANVVNCTPQRLPFSISGNSGANSAVGSNPAPATTSMNTTACPGGGAGGGISSGDIIRDGSAGGGVFDVGSTINGGAGGTAAGTRNGTNGGAGADNILLDTSNATTNSIGTGGGGGAGGDTVGTIAGGNGANGSKGAGGGGGGASTNGANSGAGGNGGDGLCFVVEYYGA